MAKFYGKASRYLINRDHEYFLWAVLVVLAPLLAVWILSRFFSAQVVAAAAIVFLIFAVKWLQPLTLFFQHQSSKFYKGRFGEKDIKKELLQLPDSYSVFQGVVLDSSKGDIDFVLVGPQGVLSLEVKSFGGKITYNGSGLLVNEKPIFGKNILEQAFGEARAVGKFLRQHLDADIFVKPVLVFSHEHASVDFGDIPADNVYLVQKDSLFGLVHSFPQYQWQEGEREKVEALLKVTTH